jgi:hypothetical protein
MSEEYIDPKTIEIKYVWYYNPKTNKKYLYKEIWIKK